MLASTQEDFQLLCDEGCRDWTDDNVRRSECNNGESASQAVIVHPDFKGTNKGNKVLEALYNGGSVKVAGG